MNKHKKDNSNPENLLHERTLWSNGIKYIAGVDECGRGPFAGPVVACAIIMPVEHRIHRLTDSKKISKSEHDNFAELVRGAAVSYSIGISTVEEIDCINIKQASRLAMKRAIEGLHIKPEYILVDGTEVIDTLIPQHFIIKGDYNSHTVSAGAILAKVHRDILMAELDKNYHNVYGWAKNAGYQTKEHIEACRKHGLTEHHRRTWKTVELFE